MLFVMSISRSETFKVAVPLIPDLNPISNQINIGNYIGLHLYYPLFNRNEFSEISSSNFLDLNKTKSLSSSFKTYQFCLKSGIKFNDDSPIQITNLKTSLTRFSKMYPHLLNISEIKTTDDLCLHLLLEKPNPGIFKKLTGIASTILKDDTENSSFPIGLGPYKILEKNDKILRLIYRGENLPRFNQIDFILYDLKSDITAFHDINQLPPINSQNLNFFTNIIKAPSLKVYVNILNISKTKARLKVLNKINKINWLRVFDLDLKIKDRFLPIEEKINFSLQKETKVSSPLLNIPLLILDLYDTNKISIELKKLKLDKTFKIHKLSSKEFASWVFSGREYVGLMAFDSTGSISSLEGDFSVYFESFFSDKNRILTKSLINIKKIINFSQNSSLSKENRMRFMLEAEKYLIENGYVLPVGQVIHNFRFPKDINIETWFDFYSGIPKIETLK